MGMRAYKIRNVHVNAKNRLDHIPLSDVEDSGCHLAETSTVNDPEAQPD